MITFFQKFATIFEVSIFEISFGKSYNVFRGKLLFRLFYVQLYLFFLISVGIIFYFRWYTFIVQRSRKQIVELLHVVK